MSYLLSQSPIMLPPPSSAPLPAPPAVPPSNQAAPSPPGPGTSSAPPSPPPSFTVGSCQTVASTGRPVVDQFLRAFDYATCWGVQFLVLSVLFSLVLGVIFFVVHVLTTD